ncbi:MAG: Hpt domain-containing protein [Zetaproteobacteria bacterium]|nr:Hpt domain-containing protein [Zetaproteobacteria bacterium]
MAIDPCLVPLLPRFKQSCMDGIENIKVALAEGAFDTARRQAHNLKGQGGMFGFATVTEAAASLEKAALAEDQDGCQLKLETLETVIAEAVAQI